MTTIIGRVFSIFLEKRVSRSAAQLAFFLTMSIFPLLICLSVMLGSIFDDMESIREFADGVVPLEAMSVILDYLSYVTTHNSKAMLMAGLIMMGTTSGAAFRSLYQIMGDILGEPRYSGFVSYVISFVYSIFFLAGIYFSVGVVVTGNWFLRFIDDHIFFISVSDTWAWLRFVLLFLILNTINYSIYRFTAPKSWIRPVESGGMSLMPGACTASAALVAVSMVFSAFISASSRYPLVYGSLGSMIILMLWLYICGNIVILGNVLNAVLHDT